MDVPEFGARRAGRDYPPRPGAYGVIFDAERRRLAVVDTPEGCFLPGGGADPGESLEQALRREVAEECGLALTAVRELGRAAEHVHVALDDRCFRKDGTFFVAVAAGPAGTATEADHVLAWVSPEEAIARLAHESQAWVVRRVLEAGAAG